MEIDPRQLGIHETVDWYDFFIDSNSTFSSVACAALQRGEDLKVYREPDSTDRTVVMLQYYGFDGKLCDIRLRLSSLGEKITSYFNDGDSEHVLVTISASDDFKTIHLKSSYFAGNFELDDELPELPQSPQDVQLADTIAFTSGRITSLEDWDHTKFNAQ